MLIAIYCTSHSQSNSTRKQIDSKQEWWIQEQRRDTEAQSRNPFKKQALSIPQFGGEGY